MISRQRTYLPQALPRNCMYVRSNAKLTKTTLCIANYCVLIVQDGNKCLDIENQCVGLYVNDLLSHFSRIDFQAHFSSWWDSDCFGLLHFLIVNPNWEYLRFSSDNGGPPQQTADVRLCNKDGHPLLHVQNCGLQPTVPLPCC